MKSIRYMVLLACVGVLSFFNRLIHAGIRRVSLAVDRDDTLHNPKERSDFGLGSVDDDDEEEEWFL